MSVEITCQNCHSKLRIPDQAVGKQVRCPSCATVFVAAAAPGGAVPPPAESSEVNPYSPGNVAPQSPFAGSGAPAAQMTPRAIEALAATRPWVLFISILGMIGAGIYILGGLVQIAIGLNGHAEAIGLGFGMAVGSFLMFLPGWYLLQYARSLGRFVGAYDSGSLEDAMVAQRSYWRLIGIMVLVCLGLAAIGCLLGLLLPAITAARMHH
jgi:predicted Zn finger-like uncharacterized protein